LKPAGHLRSIPIIRTRQGTIACIPTLPIWNRPRSLVRKVICEITRH